MKRDLQISDAAQMSDVCGNIHDLDCFAAGAQWADSHPYWHDYPEEDLPDNGNFAMIVRLKSGATDIGSFEKADRMRGIGACWYLFLSGIRVPEQEVTGWIKLPS